MSDPKFSVYILTYNEEAKIKDCLESVKWADEIIVVDSFSTDRTVEICRQYDARVVQVSFQGFGHLRNTALEHTSYDWVLSVDADERVTPELREEVRRKLKEGPEADAYHVPRKSHFLGHWIRHCGWYPDYRQPQFFDKRKMKYRNQLVHETYDLDGKLGYLQEHVLQFPFLTLEQFLRKMERYSTLRAEEMSREGKKFRVSQLVTHPLAMFLRMYVQKLGFLDGRVGFILSLLYAYYTFMKYLKLWDLTRNGAPADGAERSTVSA